MKIANTVQISLRALRRNKMRSLLTALGIIIGVAAVIAMVSIGNGAKAQIQANIASLGENLIQVFAGNFAPGGVRSGWGGAGTLKASDAEAILREIPKIKALSSEVRAGAQLVVGNANWFTGSLLGESENYFDIRQWPLAAGGGFEEPDVRSAAKVAVIGQTIATQLFGEENPIGKILRVNSVPFVVTGVLSPKGLNLQGGDQDDLVVVPYTSAMKRLMGRNNLDRLNLQVDTASDIIPVQNQIIALMKQRHKIFPPKEDDFTVRNQEEITRMQTASTDTMTYLLGATACVSLVVGGIGIMNIMLVSVTERTREIGIRIAVGAHGKDILLQFLIEAATLSSMGGILGILLGIGTAKTISYQLHWPTLISIPWIAISFLFSAAVGILFGFYPALKASKLNPIEALRYE